MSFKIEDKDQGLNALVKNIQKNSKRRTLVVGITEESPRKQFKMALDQEFRPETAGLLLRVPVDDHKDILMDKIAEIGINAAMEGKDPKPDLLALGNQVKNLMGEQLDPPPQLKDAIIVKVEEE